MLDPGTTLGRYRIESVLGSGGMGEVYLATDTSLNRKIAIKTLLEEFSNQPDWKHRFKQEAQAVASLNHANICTLHDVGHADGMDFLVMEYLEGQNLSERVKAGQLSIDEVLRHAMQIADALHRTHRKGVIHGDLKPGNVMLTKSGVKLLDFGLAQLRVATTSSMEETNSLTLGATRDMMGTPQYMAPEQVEQRGADSRSDIFAFGAMLYEMLTNKKAFPGKSTAAVFAAILREDPPAPSSLRPGVPPALDHIVAACLVKDPDERWQDAGDLFHQLKSIRANLLEAPKPVVTTRPLLALGIVAAIAAAVALLSIGLDRRFRDSGPAPAIRFSIRQPESLVLGDVPRMALSPDGRSVAFSAGPAGGKPQIWVRDLGSSEARALAGTDNAVIPFWSPDSRSIAFLADGKMRRIDAAGGPVQVLCDGPDLDGAGTWSGDVILFAGRDPDGPIMRVSAGGGPATPVTTLGSDETNHRWPRFLPDGRHFLYLATNQQPQSGALFVGSIDGGAPKKLLDTPYMADFADGYLLFKRDLALIARPFDPDSMEFTGEPLPVADWVGSVASSRRVGLSPSTAGYLAFSSDVRSTSRLVWLDRNGRPITDLPAPPDITHVWVSPDEKRVATDSAGDVWFLDDRGVQTRATLNDSVENQPVWSHDGKHVMFASNRDDGVFKLYRKSALGLGDDELLLKDTVNLAPSDVSPDGKYLLFQKSTSTANTDLFVLPLDGGEPIPVAATRFDEIQGRFSSDGRWIAFVTNESGQSQINVRSFPSNDRKVQISANGGVQPRWRNDGKELYFVAKSGTLMVTPITSLERMTVGLPAPLFDVPLAPEVVQPLPLRMSNYVASSDGNRFLAILQNSRREDPITVLQNWTEVLRQRR